jgi:hypothetical protein
VATARKMTVLAWHLIAKDQDYAFARPALVAHKLELTAGAPSRRSYYGQPGAAHNDNNAATPKPPPPSSRKVAAAVPRPYHRR